MGTIQEKHDEGHFQHKLIYDNYQILIGTVSTEGFKERWGLYGQTVGET